MFSTSEAHATLTTATQDGFKITWTLISQPNSARTIATCAFPFGDAPPVPPKGPVPLFALNELVVGGKPLYKSLDGGVTWTFVTNLPAGVTSIACPDPKGQPPKLYALDTLTDNLIEYYGTNFSSRTIWPWSPNVKAIGTHFGGFVELDVASVGAHIRWYTSPSAAPTAFPATATAAAMVSYGRGFPQPTYPSRGFARNETTNYLSYNANGSWSGVWKRITSVVTTDYLDQISAGSATYLYALQSNPTTPGVRKLYGARFSEVNCTDGIDNDDDAYVDASDVDCQ